MGLIDASELVGECDKDESKVVLKRAPPLIGAIRGMTETTLSRMTLSPSFDKRTPVLFREATFAVTLHQSPHQFNLNMPKLANRTVLCRLGCGGL